MRSAYLNKLDDTQRKELLSKLHEIQSGKCFICEKPVDLVIHRDEIDIDHVVPLSHGGKDDDKNFALTHASCNRSKQATNLEVARVLQRFSSLKDKLAIENRSPNLGDILDLVGAGNHQFGFKVNDLSLTYSLSDTGDNHLQETPIFTDPLSGFRYFFVQIPIEYLAHDDRINPRSIGSNISKLVEEFYQKHPQLHVSLGWISSEGHKTSIHIFDGQHKAAAQILLGVRTLPVRVFIDPDPEVLITTNMRAGTSLKQVAFDKSIQRHLGSTLYYDRVRRFQTETGRGEEDLNFSERDLVDFYKGESREIKRFILDSVRDWVTSSPENKLRDFIDYGGRGKERPLSYSTIDKTFYSFFIFKDVLNTRIDMGLEEGENPRELEKKQIVELMNLLADEIYIGKFDPSIGTDKIESRLQKGEDFPFSHLRAFRMSKEEIIYNWIRYIHQIAKSYFITSGKPIVEEKLFQYQFPPQLWENIRRFVRNLAELPLWVNRDLSATAFGGKQVYSYWQTVFETGRTPQEVQVLSSSLNLINMIQ